MSTASVPSQRARETSGGTVVMPLHPPSSKTHEGATTHVDETPRHFRIRVAVAMLVVAGIALVDVIIIKTTWNQVLLDREFVSWLLAVFTALGGTAAMWTSGKLTAIVQVYPNRIKTMAAVLAAVAWAALGAGLFWLRWNAAKLAVTSVAVEGQTADDGGAHVHQLMAVVMITLYLVPGVLAWIDGYLLGNPIAAHQRRTAAKVRELDDRLHTTEAEATMVSRLLAMHADEIEQIEDRAREAKRANAALADELMAHARAEILRRLGDPAAGGITHPADQPRPHTSAG